MAQLYASQVIHRLSEKQTALEEDSEFKETAQDFINIDVNSIEKFEPRTVGAEHLMLQMAEQLKLSQKLHQLGLSATEVSIAIGAIIARSVAPDSERATYTWLCNDSGLGELLDIDFKEKWLYCESEAKSAVASQMKQSFEWKAIDEKMGEKLTGKCFTIAVQQKQKEIK